MTTSTTQMTHTSSAWDATHDSRETFLAYLQAQCAPGQPKGPVPTTGRCTDPTIDTAAAVLLSLLDQSTSLAIEGQSDESLQWLYEVTGAPVSTVSQADFVVATDNLADVLAQAKRGTADHPEYGATVIFADLHAVAEVTATVSGPGIEHPVQLGLPLPTEAIEARAVANAAYPTGVDVLIARGEQLIAFPRSTQISLEGVDDVRGNA